MRIKLIITALIIVGAIAAVAASPDLKEMVTSSLGMGTAKQAHEGGDAEHSSSHEGAEHEGGEHEGGEHFEHVIVATEPVSKEVTLCKQYVCQIHSRRHIELKALEGGYLEEIKVKEGQAVKKGDTLFQIVPTIYKARLDADLAEAQLAQVEYDNTRKLVQQEIVSIQELKLAKAKLQKALAQVNMAKAEFDFADIKAPFDGIIDRLYEQEGSLIDEGEMLTTMSDNSLMWVYFNMPEAGYLEYQEATKNGRDPESLDIRLKLANQQIFPEPGKIGAIEADFNNETGNIAFRADVPNPERLLRHGQTGNILISQQVPDAVVIPQRATYEILAKKYVFVIDKDDVIRQREIHVQHENEDIFIVDKGLKPGEKIVFEGIRQVRDGDKVEYELKPAEELLSNLKFHAE